MTLPALICCPCLDCSCDCATNLPASITINLETPYQILNADTTTYSTISSITLDRYGCCYRGWHFDGVEVFYRVIGFPPDECELYCYRYFWRFYTLIKVPCKTDWYPYDTPKGEWRFCSYIHTTWWFGQAGDCTDPVCEGDTPTIQYPEWWDNACEIQTPPLSSFYLPCYPNTFAPNGDGTTIDFLCSFPVVRASNTASRYRGCELSGKMTGCGELWGTIA